MREKVTINDVARLAGVSKRTVSRVLNESPVVAKSSREKVQRIISELGYQPNPQARGLAASRSYLIGLVYDNPDPFFMESVIRGISSVCIEKGYELVIRPSDRTDPNLVDQVINFVSRAQIDGVILPPPISEMDAIAEELEANGVPCVRLAAAQIDEPHRLVISDERSGAKQMTEYLINSGHSRIGYISGPKGLKSTWERREGYLDALRSHDLEVDPDLLIRGAYTFESGVKAGRELLGAPQRPTAIFASNDQMAIGVVNAARELGLTVPADLSVAGFDDHELAAQIIPSLTTIRRPVQLMATLAAQKLIATIDGHHDAASDDCVLNPELVLRDSTAPIS